MGAFRSLTRRDIAVAPVLATFSGATFDPVWGDGVIAKVDVAQDLANLLR